VAVIVALVFACARFRLRSFSPRRQMSSKSGRQTDLRRSHASLDRRSFPRLKPKGFYTRMSTHAAAWREFFAGGSNFSRAPEPFDPFRVSTIPNPILTWTRNRRG